MLQFFEEFEIKSVWEIVKNWLTKMSGNFEETFRKFETKKKFLGN